MLWSIVQCNIFAIMPNLFDRKGNGTSTLFSFVGCIGGFWYLKINLFVNKIAQNCVNVMEYYTMQYICNYTEFV